MSVVVCDTGPPLHLAEAGLLFLLELTGSAHIPPAVDRELSSLLPAPRSRPAWMGVEALTFEYAAWARLWESSGLLHRGEAEAVALAQQLGADWLLTDDGTARLFATGLGVEVHGSLGVVIWAAATRILNREEAHDALNRLCRSSLWLSPLVLREAGAALARLFPAGSNA